MTNERAESADDWRSLLTMRELERAARKKLWRPAYDYYRSGADAERTLRQNQKAFSRYAIHYRVLVDVSSVDLSTEVLGLRVDCPVMIAPTAYHKLAHTEGEAATARAAETLGSLMIVSTLATMTLEDVARASAAPKWFQLYVHKDRGFTRSLVERAEAAGYLAIVLTVDTPVLGRRLADVRNGFALPPPLVMANLVDATADVPLTGSALAAYVASRHDASLTFRDVEWLQSLTKLPIVLKGVVRGDDAKEAARSGAAGIIVSNHGARQLDGSVATIDALAGVVDAVGDSAAVMMDGGVRWGTDVLKALALGARAVFVGRPVLWGLAVGGEEGVAHVLTLLRGELARAMALAGCPNLEATRRDLIRPASR